MLTTMIDRWLIRRWTFALGLTRPIRSLATQGLIKGDPSSVLRHESVPSPGTLRHLAAGAILKVDRPTPAEIKCLTGIIWITQDSDPRDVILKAGETYRPDRQATVLIQALVPADVGVTA